MSGSINRIIIFVMGVSGSGKTSIGRLLASKLSVPFIDADDYHPESNVEKMSQGIPLNDLDRFPWLDRLNEVAKEHMDMGCVIGCSALKEAYRKRLTHSIESKAQWVYLRGSYDCIYQRMKNRKEHFMDAKMLMSQFETLEEPINALVIDISDSPSLIVQNVLAGLK